VRQLVSKNFDEIKMHGTTVKKNSHVVFYENAYMCMSYTCLETISFPDDSPYRPKHVAHYTNM